MKKWILIVVGILTLVGGIIGISALVKNKDDGLKEINPTFTRGGLNQVGEWVDGNETIYTKEMFECQGLTIALDFEHNIKYEVFYYDENGVFIEKTGQLTEDYVNDDLSRIFARIVITPDWSKIDTNKHEVKWYQVNSYANQITIKVNEKQVDPPKPVTLITFYLLDIELQCEEGMTWAEFIDSDYNIVDGLTNVTSYLGGNIYDSNKVAVNSTDIITEQTYLDRYSIS